jgi:hypothetical protein
VAKTLGICTDGIQPGGGWAKKSTGDGKRNSNGDGALGRAIALLEGEDAAARAGVKDVAKSKGGTCVVPTCRGTANAVVGRPTAARAPNADALNELDEGAVTVSDGWARDATTDVALKTPEGMGGGADVPLGALMSEGEREKTTKTRHTTNTCHEQVCP